jgi:GNAT superfamily N-acetyltransferase
MWLGENAQMNNSLDSIELRSARADEAEILLEIQRAASLAAYPHIFPPEEYPFPNEGVLAQWEEALANPEITVLVAEVDGRPIGAVTVASRQMKRLYVLPEAWGRGVGTRLHDQALAIVASRGHTTCHLFVLEQNEIGRRFYEGRGWQPDGSRQQAPFPPHPAEIGYVVRLHRTEGE